MDTAAPTPTSDRVYGILLDAIVEGTLLPAQRIGENDLAKQIAVSRTPIREALQRLERDGFVVIFPQRGTFVAPLDIQAIRSAYVIRLALEAEIVGEAARLRTAADVENLRHDIAEQAATLAENEAAVGRFFELNTVFHRRLAAIADLTGVLPTLDAAKRHLDRVRAAHLQFADPYPLTPLVSEHTAIVDAVAAGDVARAQAEMRHHIGMVLPRLDLLRTRRPQFFKLPIDVAQPLRRAR